MKERQDEAAGRPVAKSPPSTAGILAASSSAPAGVPTTVDLSVVIPVYNEAHRIAETVETVHRWLARRRSTGGGGGDGARSVRSEIIVVSDGSSDDPAAQVEVGERDGVITHFIELPENRGKGAAVRRGILAAQGALVLFSDADLATPIEEASGLEAAIVAGADVAIASRRVADSDVQVEQSIARRWTGGLFPRVVRLLTGLRHADTQCGFKMFRRETVDALFSPMREERFAFDVELLCAAREDGLQVAEVGVVWRDSGETTVKLLRDPFRMATTLLRLADPQRFPRVFARQLGLTALVTLALLVFARGAFHGPVPLFPASQSSVIESGETMADGGDWLVPTRRIADRTEPVFGRAPLADWSIALSVRVFGAGEFSRRLPSYLSGLLLLALVFRAARCFGQRDLAALATLVLGSSLLFLALWGTEITDLTATLTLSGTWLCAVISRSPGSEHPLWWRGAHAVFLGLALLSVGPLALPLALLPRLLGGSGAIDPGSGEREIARRGEKRSHALGVSVAIAMAVVVALPWYLLVELREPGAWRAFFTDGAGVSVGAVWWTWIVGLLPWPLLLLLSGKRSFVGLGRRIAADARVRALLAAAFLPPIVATVIRPSDPTWILPALPPAAVVLALGIRSGLTGAVEFRYRIALFAAVPAAVLILVLAMAVVRPVLFEPWVGVSSAVVAMAFLGAVATKTARRAV